MLIDLKLLSILKCYSLIVSFYIFVVSNDPSLYIMKEKVSYIFSKYAKNTLGNI